MSRNKDKIICEEEGCGCEIDPEDVISCSYECPKCGNYWNVNESQFHLLSEESKEIL